MLNYNLDVIFFLVPNFPGAKLSGAKLSGCQIFRCQIVLVPNCPTTKYRLSMQRSQYELERSYLSFPGTPSPGWPLSTTRSLCSWRTTRLGHRWSKVWSRSTGQTKVQETPHSPRPLSSSPSSWTTWRAPGPRMLTSTGAPSTSLAHSAASTSPCTRTWRSSPRTRSTSSPRPTSPPWSTLSASWTAPPPKAPGRSSSGRESEKTFWESWKRLTSPTSTCSGIMFKSTSIALIWILI